ncbi:hypothetical protein OHB26_17235 [Nocardia sp. NBC_01503]|uniref:hypothetical protein n=1 Tax=Nocardia sp. NBC_01503 TaxID=2975997 RepID=UPI002E7BD97E|nr:hypothetical protein [Nocardia sp. NBC_01503]WTL35785.1 hypothetical protein OHB26_17235 [Nocardia sp. NBC_01503]
MTPSDEPIWIDYAEFGERFVAAAVTESRIEAAVSGMAGRGMTIGPFSIGPAGLARFVAKGSVGKPTIIRRGPHVHFDVALPVKLRVDVTLGGQRLRLEAVVDIDLRLHARTADPLLIVIDIPPVTGRDVSFVMRAQAIGAAFDLLVDPIAKLVQREVANRINAILEDPDAQRGRTFDVEAILNGSGSPYRGRPAHDWIDYGEFGHRFFERIVTVDRVREVVESMAGKPIEVGPIRTGPGNRAQVAVHGTVRLPRIVESTHDPAPVKREPVIAELPTPAGQHPIPEADTVDKADLVTFDLTIPVSLDITVDVLQSNRYSAELQVPVALTARAAEPLLIVIDAAPPAPEQIELELKAQGLRAATLGKLAGIRRQVAIQVASVVRAEVADTSRRTIDVGARLDGTRV